MSTHRSSSFARNIIIVFGLVALTVPATAAPRGKRDPQRTITRYKKYLSRKPYHGWAFDKLVEAAVAVNQLEKLVADYRRQVEEEPDDRAARVVLVRLLAKTNKVDDALVELKKVPKPDAGVFKLRGELFLRRNQPKQALVALQQAAAATRDKKLLQEIQRRRGEAALMAGRRADAVKAFRAMAELQPRSFNARLDVAEVFAQHNLVEEALTAFDEADELAGRDTAKRCRVLAAKGRLYERLIRIPEALKVYRKATALMGRGNWLKRELNERVLAIHKRSGKLDELLTSCRAQVAASPQDLDAREFLAQALIAADQKPQARDVLQAAAKSFPEDLALSRRLIGLLRELKDTQGVIAEYQRAIGKHPRELDLYLELGKVFASSGKLEQAKRQWERSLEKRLKDAGLCVRLAELYAFYDQPAEAIRLYKRAIALEPKEVRHTGDLARYLAARGRQAEVRPLLEATARAVRGNPSGLEALGRLWQEHGHAAEALAAMQQALALKPKDPRLLTALADLQVQLQQLDAAAATLHRLINQAREPAMRRAAVDKLIRLVRKRGDLKGLIKAEEGRVAKKTREVSPYLLLAKAHTIQRRPKQAIAVLEALLALRPGFEDAHDALARLYRGQADYAKALANYQALVKTSPQARRKYLKAIARIHLTLFQHEKALACYEEILRGSPDNPSAFKEVGKAYAKLNMIGKARDCLQQAVRLKPQDARLRLELANLHQRLGDAQAAKQELKLAVRSAEDETLRDEARGKLYELLAEEGRIDETVEGLKSRIEKNPYDVASPLTLVDIFVRELEYEQALELLDKLLGYQPKERRLLQQRARIRFLLERYAEAIADFETLWKLPKSDLEDLGLKIAECALKAGNLERAKRALESVKDAQAVADLYEAHDLMPEAVAALERGAKRSPNDARLFQELSQKLNKVERRDEAIASLERVIALRGERWKTVLQLGNLYREAGKTDEAVEVGRRLFAIIRLRAQEPPKKKKRKRLARKGGGYASYWSYGSSYYSRYNYYRRSRGFASADYRRRINQLRSFFQQLSQEDTFTELARAELKLQPKNPALLTTLLNHLRRGQEKQQQAVAILQEVQAATVPKGLHPAGFTPRTWALYLEQQLVSRYQRDKDVCKQRVAELTKRVDAGATAEREWLQLIQLLRSLRRYDQARARLQAGVEKLPQSYRLRIALAKDLLSEKKPAEAAEHYRAAVKLIAARPVDAKDRAQQRADVYKQNRQSLLQGFPAWFRGKVREEHLRRLFKLTRSSWTGSTNWGLGYEVGLEAVKQALVRTLFKVGTDAAKAEARALIQSLEPSDPERLQEWSAVNQLYFAHEFFDDAARTSRALLALEAKLDRDPVLGHNRRWAANFDRSIRNLASVLEKRKEFLAAYELYRTYGNASAGELVLKSQELLDEATERYRAECLKHEPAAKRGDRDARDRYRRAGIKWAETLQYRKRWKQVIEIFERLIKVLPDDFPLYEQVALLHERAGRSDAAVAVHQRIITRKRQLNRVLRRDLRPAGRQLEPLAPPGVGKGNEDWIWRSIRGSYYSSYYGRPSARRYSVRTNYASILKAYLDRRQIGKAAEAMRRLAREDMSTFRWLGWYLGRLIENYRLGAKGVPIMRLLYSYNPSYDHLGIQYGKALVAAKRWKEARRVLSEVVNRRGSRNYYGRQAQQILDRAEAKLSGKKSVSLDDLRAAVTKDPRSMKKRLRLAARLVDERRYREALAQVREVRKHAPHLKEGKQLLRACYQALGMQKELIAEMRKELKGATGRARFGKLMELVEQLYDGLPGEVAALTPEIKKLLAEADAALVKAGASQQRWSVAMWYLMRGYLDHGKRQLEVDLERLKQDKSRADQVRNRLNRLAFAAGDPLPALEFVWKKMKDQTSWSGQQQIVSQLASTLRRTPYPERLRDVVFAEAKKHGGIRGDLYRLAYHLAVHDVAAVRKVLDQAIARAGKGGYYLHTFRMRLDAHGDPQRQLELLEAREALRVAGKLEALGQSDDQAKQAFVRRKAKLLLELERPQEAMKLWEAEYDAAILQNKRRLSSLYAQHGDLPAAVRLLKEYIAKTSDKDYGLLERLAGLYEQQERWEDAIELHRRVMILEPSRASSAHNNMRRCYKASGKLPEYRKYLEQKVAADPDDMETLGYLISLAFAMDDDARAVAGLEVQAKRHNLAPNAWERLAEHYWARGERDEAVKYMEKRLAGNVESWQLRNMTERLAEYHLGKQDVKHALTLLKKGYQDPDSPQSLHGIARFLLRHERVAEALPLYAEAVQQRPRDASLRRGLATALRRTGRHREALEHLFAYAFLPQSVGQLHQLGPELAFLADACGEDARLAKALAANEAPKTPAAREARKQLLLRAAMLDLARRRLTPARERFDAALVLFPEDLLATWGRAWVAWLAPDLDDAQRRFDALYARIDREQSKLYGLRSQLRRLRSEVRLRRGDQAGAQRLWRKLERLRGSSAYQYAFYNDPFNWVGAEAQQLGSHHLYPAWKQSLERALLLQGGHQGTFTEALFRTGDHERALQRAWLTIDDPVGPILGNQYRASRRSYISSGRFRRRYYSRSRDTQGQLLRFHRELGRLGALRKRLEALEAKHPKRYAVRSFLDRLLEEEGDHEALLARYRARRAESLAKAAKQRAERAKRKLPPRDRPETHLRAEIVEQLIELGRWDEALTEQRALLADLRKLDALGGSSWVRYGRRKRRYGTFSSSSYRYSSSQVSALGASRRRAMALLARAGERAEAAKLEAEELKEAGPYQLRTGAAHLQLARAYAEAKQVEDVARLLELARQHVKRDTDKARITSAEVDLWQELEQPERLAAAVKRVLERLEAELAKAPFSRSVRLQRAQTLVEHRVDLPGAQKLAEQLIAEDPRVGGYWEVLGWSHYRQGRPAEALKAFRTAEQLAREQGGAFTAELLFGLGLAQAKSDPNAARPLLRRALALSPQAESADEAREVLK